MDIKEIEGLAILLDVTPVRVRKYLALRDKYAGSPHITVVLYPALFRTDALIMGGMGWGPVSS